MRTPALLLGLLLPAAAGAQSSTDPSLVYDRVQAMVPMRDGVRLETEAYVPKGRKEPLPVLFMRTPYGFSPDARGFSQWLTRPWLQDLLHDGYILVLQSVRGRFRSEGRFVVEPPFRDRSDPRSTDEGTDAYDTVEWMLARLPTNGRVGMLGASNPARLVAMAMLEHHPAVKAYSPQAVPADNFLGDDFFHHGAFRLMMIDFIHGMESSPGFTAFPFDRADLYAFWLAAGPLSRVDDLWMQGKRLTWNEVLAHPTYDAFWKSHALPARLSKVPAPTLNVGGAFDQEDRRGPLALYQALEAGDDQHRNFLVIGPWSHRSWRLWDGDKLGRIDFGSPTARWYREQVQAPFFACQLKDRCGPPLPEALVFQTGSNVWQRLPAWPPKESLSRSLYLHAGGKLSFDPPAADGDGEADAFVSDPAAPVPSQPRPIVASTFDQALHDEAWATSLVTDQRFVDGRPDVLTFQTEPLQDEVVVSGPIHAQLFVSTTGTDADFVAKLIDVFPETGEKDATLGGYELMVAGEIMRGRFRKGFEKGEPFAPNKVEAVDVDLLPGNHMFRRGHRIMVQVHSTWFPLYDRNPQTWVPSIFEAKASDFVRQTHKVYRSKKHPSRVTFAAPKP